MDFQLFSLVMLFLACVEQSLATCVVDSFTVKEDFDPIRVSTEKIIAIQQLRTDQVWNIVKGNITTPVICVYLSLFSLLPFTVMNS